MTAAPEYRIQVGGIDPALVHRWLSTDSYWAAQRTLEQVVDSLAHSLVHVAVSPAGEPVGLARAVTDHTTFAWVCDVYIHPGHRGRGLGSRLVGGLVTELRAAGVRRLVLATRDAHGVYAKLGFTELTDPGMWMELRAP